MPHKDTEGPVRMTDYPQHMYVGASVVRRSSKSAMVYQISTTEFEARSPIRLLTGDTRDRLLYRTPSMPNLLYLGMTVIAQGIGAAPQSPPQVYVADRNEGLGRSF